MEFCTITPIAGLEKYGTALSNRHLVLAHMLHNNEYLSYYVKRRLAGDFLILDNGAYENTRPLDWPAYFNWIRNLDPQVVCLPDKLMSPWRETTSMALQFLDQFADHPTLKNFRTQWMYVPQAERRGKYEVLKSIAKVLDDGRQGHKISWVGLGRYLATEFKPINALNFTYRCEVAEWVKKNFPHVKMHALGMAAGNTNELVWLNQIGVESIDSSCAVWRGWNGYALGDEPNELAWQRLGTPCDFFATDSQCHTTISYNLEVIRRAISSGTGIGGNAQRAAVENRTYNQTGFTGGELRRDPGDSK